MDENDAALKFETDIVVRSHRSPLALKSKLFHCPSPHNTLLANPTMHLMYTVDEVGNRIYTLKVCEHTYCPHVHGTPSSSCP